MTRGGSEQRYSAVNKQKCVLFCCNCAPVVVESSADAPQCPLEKDHRVVVRRVTQRYLQHLLSFVSALSRF